jgi:ribosomal protein S18 acetylase RimI-like enzyme
MAPRLAPPASDADWLAARRLIEEYAAGLGVDLCFQGIDQELAHLPEHYGPPAGAFLLAFDGKAALGCVGLRKHADGVAEMKRLYVAPAGRRLGAGRRLAERILDEAKRLGYRHVVLDTLPSMKEAQALYATLGFRPTTAYRFNPVPGTVYLEKAL